MSQPMAEGKLQRLQTEKSIHGNQLASQTVWLNVGLNGARRRMLMSIHSPVLACILLSSVFGPSAYKQMIL